jgi:hypothetical protein
METASGGGRPDRREPVAGDAAGSPTSSSTRVSTSARRELDGPWTKEPPRVDLPRWVPRSRNEAVLFFLPAILMLAAAIIVAWALLTR